MEYGVWIICQKLYSKLGLKFIMICQVQDSFLASGGLARPLVIPNRYLGFRFGITMVTCPKRVILFPRPLTLM